MTAVIKVEFRPREPLLLPRGAKIVGYVSLPYDRVGLLAVADPGAPHEPRHVISVGAGENTEWPVERLQFLDVYQTRYGARYLFEVLAEGKE